MPIIKENGFTKYVDETPHGVYATYDGRAHSRASGRPITWEEMAEAERNGAVCDRIVASVIAYGGPGQLHPAMSAQNAAYRAASMKGVR